MTLEVARIDAKFCAFGFPLDVILSGGISPELGRQGLVPAHTCLSEAWTAGLGLCLRIVLKKKQAKIDF